MAEKLLPDNTVTQYNILSSFFSIAIVLTLFSSFVKMCFFDILQIVKMINYITIKNILQKSRKF